MSTPILASGVARVSPLMRLVLPKRLCQRAAFFYPPTTHQRGAPTGSTAAGRRDLEEFQRMVREHDTQQERERHDGEIRDSLPAAGEPSVPLDTDEAVQHEDTPMGEADVQDDVHMGFIGSLEPAPEDQISPILLQQLGSAGRRYKRESRQAFRRIVSEIYSPPRITAELRKMRGRHLMPGLALDLTVIDPDDGLPWDFSKSD